MKNLKLNLTKMIKLRGVPFALAATLIATGLTGCGKKAECSVSGNHAHLYTNSQGFERYIDKEYLSYEGYDRQEDYITLTSEDEKLSKFEDKHNLLKIEDNIEAIASIQEQNHDYIEYRYAYTYLMPIPHTTRVGKVTTTYFTYIPTTHHSWTSDPEHSRLTGEQRRCHHVYQAYNVVIDDKGKYVLVPSEEVDDIFALNGEYTYIKEKFYKVIDAEYGYELDYEDGKEDDPDLIEEDENQVTQSSTESYTSEEPQKKLTKSLS